MGINETLINYISLNYPDNISLQDIVTIFNANQWGDISKIIPEAQFSETTPIELDASCKNLLSSISIEKIVQNQTDIKSLSQLYSLLKKKDWHLWESKEFKAAQEDIIQYLETIGLEHNIAQYFIVEALILAARETELKCSIYRQAHSQLFEEIKSLLLTEPQLKYLMQDTFEAESFKTLFPTCDQALIDFLDVDKKYHLLGIHHIQLVSENMKNYAKSIYHERRDVKRQIYYAISQLPINDALLNLFKECKEINENKNLTEQEKLSELIKAFSTLSVQIDKEILGDILVLEPWFINNEIIYHASKQLNKMIMEHLTLNEDIDDGFLEKVISSHKTATFSQSYFGFVMSEHGAAPIHPRAKKLATKLLLDTKIKNNDSAVFLSKLLNESRENMIRQLCDSQSFGEVIISENLFDDFASREFQGYIINKIKWLVNKELLSMDLSRAQIKKVIHYYESYPKNPRDLSLIIDPNILSALDSGNILSRNTIEMLEKKLQLHEGLTRSFNEKIEDVQEIEKLHELYETFNFDETDCDSISEDTKELKSSLEIAYERLEEAIEKAAKSYAERSIKHMPDLYINNVEMRVKDGGDREAIMDEYRQFYYKRGLKALEEYVKQNIIGASNRDIINQAPDVLTWLKEIDSINRKIKQIQITNMEEKIHNAKHKLREFTPELMEEDLSFIDDTELELLASHTKQSLVSRLEQRISQQLSVSYLDKNQLSLILDKTHGKDIAVYIDAFPEIDQEVIALLAQYNEVFNETCQVIAADFLDEKAEFEMAVIEFLENKPNFQDLRQFVELTETDLGGVLKTNQIKQFFQNKIGCKQHLIDKFSLPMSQWLNQKANFYLAEQLAKQTEKSSIGKILDKLNVDVDGDGDTDTETVSIIEGREQDKKDKFVSIAKKELPNESPISVQSDITDKDDLSETEPSPTQNIK